MSLTHLRAYGVDMANMETRKAPNPDFSTKPRGSSPSLFTDIETPKIRMFVSMFVVEQ